MQYASKTVISVGKVQVSWYPCGMLYLASKSPRRKELLERIGIEFGILDLDIPEQRDESEPAFDYVKRVAREKAGAGLMTVIATPGAMVLGADTEVILDDVVFGKPVDRADAERMLRTLSGRTHQVVTAVALVNAGQEAVNHHVSEVTFDALDDDLIAWYLDTNEWQGKAGAYAIQGKGEMLIRDLKGSFSSVMGLPVQMTGQMLRQFGATL